MVFLYHGNDLRIELNSVGLLKLISAWPLFADIHFYFYRLMQSTLFYIKSFIKAYGDGKMTTMHGDARTPCGL